MYTYASLGEKNRNWKWYVHTFAPLKSNRKTMKSASGKRHPDEAHGPGEETSRPQQCNEAAPNPKSQLNVVNHFRIFAVLSSTCDSLFAIVVQKSPILMKYFQNFSNFYGEDQNLLDSQISWYLPLFGNENCWISENGFQKVRNNRN